MDHGAQLSDYMDHYNIYIFILTLLSNAVLRLAAFLSQTLSCSVLPAVTPLTCILSPTVSDEPVV